MFHSSVKWEFELDNYTSFHHYNFISVFTDMDAGQKALPHLFFCFVLFKYYYCIILRVPCTNNTCVNQSWSLVKVITSIYTFLGRTQREMDCCFLATRCQRWRIPDCEIKITQGPKLSVHNKEDLQSWNDTQNMFIYISQVCMETQSTFGQYDGICLSEVSMKCMFVWELNNIPCASDSNMSANFSYIELCM